MSDYIPRRINTNLDAQGNALGHSGPVARRAQLEDGPCLTFTGTEYATDAGLVGTETVVSNGGTSTPSISAGRIDFTAGTCWDLILSNGSRYPMSEQSGTVAYDVVNSNHLQLVNTPSWGTQDVFFWGEHYGYSLYEHASSDDMFVPLKTDGTALSITPQTGYTKTDDYLAGPYHNDTQATLRGYLAASDSEAAIYFGASFGTSSIRLEDDFSWHQSWTFTAKVKPLSVSGTKNLYHSTSADYGIKIVDDDIVVRLNGTDHTFGDIPLTTSESDVSIEFAGGDAADITVTVDGVSQTISGPTIGTNTSIPWIGASNVPDNHYAGMLRGITITNNGSTYYESPLYKDSLDRSSNCNHGTDTDITYLNNPASEVAALNPTITSTETLAQTDGNKKLILVGHK